MAPNFFPIHEMFLLVSQQTYVGIFDFNFLVILAENEVPSSDVLMSVRVFTFDFWEKNTYSGNIIVFCKSLVSTPSPWIVGFQSLAKFCINQIHSTKVIINQKHMS